MGINLKSIKYENVKSVAMCFSSAEAISRADISAKTGLSLVTVGKTVDALISEGVILEEKRVNAGAGRRAGWLVLNPEKIVVIVELNETELNIKVYDIRRNMLDCFSKKAERGEEYDSVLNDLLADAAMSVLQDFGVENCIGVGILTDSYEKKDRYLDVVSSFFPDTPVIADSQVNYSALFASHSVDGSDMLLFMSVGAEKVCGAFVAGRKLMPKHNGRYADFSSTVFPDGESFIEKLHNARNSEEYARLICDCICNTANIVMPDKVIVELEKDLPDGPEELIKKEMSSRQAGKNRFGLMVSSDSGEMKSSYRGTILRTCEKWLESFAFEK